MYDGAPASRPHRLQQAGLEAVEDRIHAELEAGRHARVTLDLEALA